MSPLSRRGFLLGLGAALAAPAIVRAEIIMPVRKVVLPPPIPPGRSLALGWLPCDGREVSSFAYPDLFDVIGRQYGGSAWLKTFKVPDMNWATQPLYSGQPPHTAIGIRAEAGSSFAPPGSIREHRLAEWQREAFKE